MEHEINPHIHHLMPSHMMQTLCFALVKFGGGVVQMSGSIAGDTFARNRYGNYVRARTKPINPNTNRQVEVRAALSLLTEHWADILTANQREAWGDYAAAVAMKNRLGESIKLSGFNHFIRSNHLRITTSGPWIPAGPVVNELPGADPTFAITASATTQLITITFDDVMAWANEVGGRMFIFGGKPQNTQRNFFAGPWRGGGFFAGQVGAAPASPLPVGTFYQLAQGQRLWVYARISRADTRLSEKFYADCIIGA